MVLSGSGHHRNVVPPLPCCVDVELNFVETLVVASCDKDSLLALISPHGTTTHLSSPLRVLQSSPSVAWTVEVELKNLIRVCSNATNATDNDDTGSDSHSTVMSGGRRQPHLIPNEPTLAGCEGFHC